jgi:hypothetical protein
MTDVVPGTIDPRRDSFNDGIDSALRTSDKQRKEGTGCAARTVAGEALATKASQLRPAAVVARALRRTAY